MRKEVVEEKTCLECAFYIQHYVKLNANFKRINHGHCTNKKPSGHFRKTDKPCEHWEKKEDETEEIKSTIKEVIISMANHLNECLQILKDDAEHD